MGRCTVLTVTECLIYSDITAVVEGNLHVSIQSDNRDLAEFSFQHFQICPNFFFWFVFVLFVFVEYQTRWSFNPNSSFIYFSPVL